MDVLIVLASLVPILLLGDLARRWILPKGLLRGERFALALMLGSGIAALLLFYFSLFHVSSALTLTIVTVLVAVSVAYGGKFFLGWRPAPFRETFPVLVLVPILFLAGLVTLVALNIDLGFDGWSNWGFKAHVAFIEGGWATSFFTYPWPQFIHQDYPLLIASLEAWAFAFLSRIDEQAIKIIFPLFYLGLLLFFYSAAREIRSTPVSLLFTILLGTTPYLSSIAAPSGYADVPLMLYIFGAVMFLRRWFEGGKEPDLLIGAILAALGVWVKREGMVYWGVNFLAVAIWLALARSTPARDRVRSLVIFLLPASLIVAPWFAFLTTLHIPPSDFAFVLDLTRWIRLPVIAMNMVGQFLAVNMWGGLWILFLIFSIARLRHLNFVGYYVWACAVMPFGLLQLSFLFSTWGPFTEHLILASDRLCMHEVAIAWYWIAMHSTSLEQWLNQIIA